MTSSSQGAVSWSGFMDEVERHVNSLGFGQIPPHEHKYCRFHTMQAFVKKHTKETMCKLEQKDEKGKWKKCPKKKKKNKFYGW